MHRIADQIALSGSIGNDNSLVVGHLIVQEGSHIDEVDDQTLAVEGTNNVRHLMVKERTTMPLVVDGKRLVAVEGTNIEEQEEGVDDGLIAIQ